MDMGPRLIQAFAGVTHACDALAAIHPLTNAHRDLAEMTVKTVVRRPIPVVFDHDVATVVGITRHLISMHDFAVGDRPHVIEWLASRIAMQAPDVDPFMESGVDQPLHRRHRIADKAVTAALPGS